MVEAASSSSGSCTPWARRRRALHDREPGVLTLLEGDQIDERTRRHSSGAISLPYLPVAGSGVCVKKTKTKKARNEEPNQQQPLFSRLFGSLMRKVFEADGAVQDSNNGHEARKKHRKRSSKERRRSDSSMDAISEFSTSSTTTSSSPPITANHHHTSSTSTTAAAATAVATPAVSKPDQSQQKTTVASTASLSASPRPSTSVWSGPEKSISTGDGGLNQIVSNGNSNYPARSSTGRIPTDAFVPSSQVTSSVFVRPSSSFESGKPTLARPTATPQPYSAPSKLSTSVIPRLHARWRDLTLEEERRRLAAVREAFMRNGGALGEYSSSAQLLQDICKAADLPLYSKRLLYDALTENGSRAATITHFEPLWNAMHTWANDATERLVFLLTIGRRSNGKRRGEPARKIDWLDFEPMVLDVILTHPALEFIRHAHAFHDSYVQFVILRIFHMYWRSSRTGCLTADQLRSARTSSVWNAVVAEQRRSSVVSDLENGTGGAALSGSGLDAQLRRLESGAEVKYIEPWAYEPFYVAYCKFYDLDTDRDMLIDEHDLRRYQDGAFPPTIRSRILAPLSDPSTRRPWAEAVLKSLPSTTIAPAPNARVLTFVDFSRLLMSDEDKMQPSSVEFWCRLLSEPDGKMYWWGELRSLYTELADELRSRDVDVLAYAEVVSMLCDHLDLDRASFTAKDVRRVADLGAKLLNCFVNWTKFFEQESDENAARAALQCGVDPDGKPLSRWLTWALDEYAALLARGDDEEEDDDEEEEEEEEIEEDDRIILDDDDDGTDDVLLQNGDREVADLLLNHGATNGMDGINNNNGKRTTSAGNKIGAWQQQTGGGGGYDRDTPHPQATN